VEELVPGTVSLNVLLKVLQNLLRERVPIRDIRSIAEALAGSGRSQDPVALTALARVALSRQIIQNIIGSEQNLPVITIDPSLEQLLLSTVQQAQKAGADDGAFIEPGLADRLQNSLINAAQKQEMSGKPLVLLVAAPLRTMMARFVRQSLPDMRVLAYTEIPENKQITIDASVGA
jgi:flagellar biosynthesis protein FlhA